MKLQKLLLLAGLLLASGLQAMQPLAPGLVSTDYSDDSGSESEVEDFPLTVKKYQDQPTRLSKPVETKPGALLFEKEYDKPYIGGVSRAPLKPDTPLEPGILEYADSPSRAYPTLPKGLFIPPLGDEPSLAKQAPVYADKPIVLPAKKELTPSETPRTPVTTLPVTVIQPQQPVVAKPSPFKPQQTVGIVGALLGQRIQHSEFEVAIANSTNDTYKVSYNNQIITLQPNDVKTIDLPNLVKTTGPTIVRSRTTAGTTTTSTTSRSIEKQTITLERASDKQQFSLNIGRGSNDKKQIVAAIGLSQGKQVIKTANAIFNPPGLGQNVYYVMQINLLGNDLKETTIQITPMPAQ